MPLEIPSIRQISLTAMAFFLVKRARKLNLRFIHQARAPTLASPVGGGFEPGDRALADELALELRERRKDMKE